MAISPPTRSIQFNSAERRGGLPIVAGMARKYCWLDRATLEGEWSAKPRRVPTICDRVAPNGDQHDGCYANLRRRSSNATIALLRLLSDVS